MTTPVPGPGPAAGHAGPEQPTVPQQPQGQGYGQPYAGPQYNPQAPMPQPPPGYAYPAPTYPVGGQPRPSNAAGTTAMVTGITSLALFWVPFVNLVLGVVAIAFGIVGRRKVSSGQATNGGQATAGLVTGLVTTSLVVLFFLLVVVGS